MGMPSLIAKPTKPLPRETTSEYDEALLLLERCLPETPSRLWIKECQKNMRVAGRHRPNSLSPKDNCKSTNTGSTTKKKRRTRCKNPNCGLLHSSADECQWPKLDSHEVKSKRMTKRQKKIEEQVA